MVVWGYEGAGGSQVQAGGRGLHTFAIFDLVLFFGGGADYIPLGPMAVSSLRLIFFNRTATI